MNEIKYCCTTASVQKYTSKRICIASSSAVVGYFFRMHTLYPKDILPKEEDSLESWDSVTWKTRTFNQPFIQSPKYKTNEMQLFKVWFEIIERSENHCRVTTLQKILHFSKIYKQCNPQFINYDYFFSILKLFISELHTQYLKITKNVSFEFYIFVQKKNSIGIFGMLYNKTFWSDFLTAWYYANKW